MSHRYSLRPVISASRQPQTSLLRDGVAIACFAPGTAATIKQEVVAACNRVRLPAKPSMNAPKAHILRSLCEQMQGRGVRSVPLSGRVGYRYFDDHEWNVGDVGWLAVDDCGDLVGLDEDMAIRLDRFTKAALLEIWDNVSWSRASGTARERE